MLTLPLRGALLTISGPWWEYKQSLSGYMRSSYMTCHITGGFSLPEGARERSIHLFADDRVARGHLIGQILQVW